VTSHVKLSSAERTELGITDGLFRLSVGIEGVDDLISDIDRALAD
jgi:cystathionine beta-lyase/cystathionine gamma-synthase